MSVKLCRQFLPIRFPEPFGTIDQYDSQLCALRRFWMTAFFSACSTFNIPLNQPEKPVLLGSNIPVHEFHLKNGMTVILAEDHSSPTFAYQTWFRVGSRDEERKKTGLAHLFEHMMFKGTTRYPDGQFDRLLERSGAEGLNAYTTNDMTVYVQELPTKALPLITELEADRMTNLIVDDKAFKTELEVVQNERRMRKENNPDGTLFQEMFSIAYEKHPYHWPVIGYEEDLNGMTAKDAEAFYKRLYRPENAVVVVSGDVKPKDLLNQIERFYPKTEAKNLATRNYFQEPKQVQPRRKQITLPIQVEKLMMGYVTVPLIHSDAAAIKILESVLADGKSSRLHQSLVETGIASSVGAFQMDNFDPGLLIITAAIQKGKTASQAESFVLKALQKIGEKGITIEELKRAKNKILYGFYASLDSNSSRAEFLGKFQLAANDFRVGLNTLKEIENISSDDIQRLVRTHLQPKHRTTLIGAPKK